MKSFFKKANWRRIPPLKILIASTLGLSIAAALFSRLFSLCFQIPDPYFLLGLSTVGLYHLFFWQPLTYFLLYPTVTEGLSLSFIIYAGFNCYILWLIGSSIIERKGIKEFFKFYVLSALVIAGAVYAMQLMTHTSDVYMGNQAILCGLMIAWLMLFPTVEVRLFLLIPINAKAFCAFTLIMLLVDLSQANLLSFAANSSSVLFAYFFAVMRWKVYSPFTSLNRFESRLIYAIENFKRKLNSRPTLRKKPSTIYDFKTGRIIIDEEVIIQDKTH